MNPLVARIIAGAIGAIAIAALAWRARSLSRSGAIAATLVGTAAVAAGWHWGLLLICYFVSSSLLSRLGRARKLEHTAGMIEKAGPRDAYQVLSNGLVFSLLAPIAAAYGDGEAGSLMAAAAASLAASAADTWATEIGTWVGRPPRSIFTGRTLAVGQSGGVTLAGLLASIAGALFVASIARLLGIPPGLFGPIVVGGVVGSLADSVAGALVQRRSWCEACSATTEMGVHTCGSATRHAGGMAFIGNDLVNLLATLVGAATAALTAMRVE